MLILPSSLLGMVLVDQRQDDPAMKKAERVTKLWAIFVRCRTKMFLDIWFINFFLLKHFINAICNIGNSMACVSI